MSVSSSTLIALAERDVGQRETTGPNRSPWLDPIQRFIAKLFGWSPNFLIGQPWCGTWGAKKGDEGGYTTADNPWHPSCESMWVKASANGTLTATPMPGAAIVWRGVHTGMVVAVSGQVVHTIEGNSEDAVTRRVRALAGTHRYIVPKTLTQAAPRQTIWWLENPKPKRQIYGPWRARRSAEKSYRKLTPARQRRADVLRTGDGRWVLRVGQPRHYGPWVTQTAAKNAQAMLEKSLGRGLRRFTRTRPLPAGAIPTGGVVDDLGKTN